MSVTFYVVFVFKNNNQHQTKIHTKMNSFIGVWNINKWGFIKSMSICQAQIHYYQSYKD